MKKISLFVLMILSILFLPIHFTLTAQVDNKFIEMKNKSCDYNPPKNKTYFNKEHLNKLSKETKSEVLPNEVNHAYSKYMQPVFNQVGGSCGSSSRISYMLGYELNSHRDNKAEDLLGKYPSHFTWLLTGQNSSKADIAKFNGVPNSYYYGGFPVSLKYGGGDIYWPDEEEAPDYGWMKGYNRWLNAMHNRLDKRVFLKLDTKSNLEILKSWIYNHRDDNDFHEGGVAGAGIGTNGMEMVTIPDSLHAGGKKIVKSFGPQVDHATTWVGYDDSIGYDFNGDGKITNDIDINKDGKINMADWERGALIMLNSWGKGWANNGTVYVPYRLLKINNLDAELYYIKKNYKPKKYMKVKMEYNKRCNLKLSIGVSSDTSASKPDTTIVCHHFNFAGNGEVPMLGRWADGEMHEEPMKFALDLTDLSRHIDTSQPHKYFLYVLTKRFTEGSGKLHELSVVDNEKNKKEYAYSGAPVRFSGGDSKLVGVSVPGKDSPSKIENKSNFTDKFKLYDNYPNPFNPKTNIVFDLPKTQNVTVNIYNIRGQLVKTLYDNTLSAGKQNIDFNAKNLSSGVYIYQVKTLSKSKSGKMLLSK